MSEIEALQRRVTALESRLRASEDILAIQRLKSRYAQLVDARTPRNSELSQAEIDVIARRISALFSKDGVWEGGGALGTGRGREEIFEILRHPGLRFTWHYFMKPDIEVTGDRAQGRWDILAPCTSKDGRALWMAGVEHDAYVREDGTWLHAHMKLEVVFMASYENGWAARGESATSSRSGKPAQG